MKKVQIVPKPTCPKCGNDLDGASCPQTPEAAPKPHDFSLCIYCGQWLQFNDCMEFMTVSFDYVAKHVGPVAYAMRYAYEKLQRSVN